MRVKLILMIISFFIIGCENGEIIFTEKGRDEISKSAAYTSSKRHELFVECMQLASQIKRNSDDDVSDIIGECASNSNYMANHYAVGRKHEGEF